MLPAAGTRFAIGEEPANLARTHNSLYLWRLDFAVFESGAIMLYLAEKTGQLSRRMPRAAAA